MVWNPPGHQPGVHVPGTLVPIAYAVSQGIAGPPVAAPPPRTPEGQAAQEERWAERRQAYAKVRDKRIVELEHMSDPIARLLGAVWSFSEYRRRQSSTDAAILADAEVLSHLLPGIWARGERISLGRNPPWDTKAICEWFLEHVREQPPAMLRFERKRPWGYKEVRVPGWGFPEGSTLWVDHADGGHFLAAALTVRGDLITGSSTGDRPGAGLNALALQNLAEAAGLTPTPPSPREIPPSVGPPYDANQVLREIERLRVTTGPAVGKFPSDDWVDVT